MPTHLLHALILSHLPFEDLGSLEPELLHRGFSIETIDASTARYPLPQTAGCDLLIVLGGPIGVYDAADYPFLTAEIECLRSRLAASKPRLRLSPKSGDRVAWSPRTEDTPAHGTPGARIRFRAG